MSESSEKQEKATAGEQHKSPRVRGIGNPDSQSQDADRHRKREHPKSDK